MAVRAASDSLSMRSARASGCERQRSIASARPTISPACGPPRSLSPEKHTTAAPASTERRTPGSSASSGTRSARAPEPRSSITGTRQSAEVLDLHLLREADRSEVRLMGTQEGACVGPDRLLVVLEARPVRGPDLDQGAPDCCTTSGIRNEPPISTSWPARDDQLAPARERRGREQHGGGAVVDHERAPRRPSGRGGSPRRGPAASRAARARGRTRGSSSRGRPQRRRARRTRRAGRGRGWCGRSRRWR